MGFKGHLSEIEHRVRRKPLSLKIKKNSPP